MSENPTDKHWRKNMGLVLMLCAHCWLALPWCPISWVSAAISAINTGLLFSSSCDCILTLTVTAIWSDKLKFVVFVLLSNSNMWNILFLRKRKTIKAWRMLVSRAEISKKMTRKFLIQNIHPRPWDIVFVCIFIEQLITGLCSQNFFFLTHFMKKMS